MGAEAWVFVGRGGRSVRVAEGLGAGGVPPDGVKVAIPGAIVPVGGVEDRVSVAVVVCVSKLKTLVNVGNSAAISGVASAKD